MDKIRNYLKWDYFEEIILEKGFIYFNLYDLERLFPPYDKALKKFLTRKVKEGKLIRLKKNLYCLKRKIPSDYLIANLLYQPSYLSLEFALSYYSIIPETVYSITSVTSKLTREYVVEGKVFSYQTIKKRAFCGYLPRQTYGKTFLIATAEKTLADYLYFVSLGKKSLNDRTDWSKVDRKKVKTYLLDDFQLNPLTVKKLIP